MILPQFLSWGSIDGVDMLTGLGLAIESGSDSFAALYTPKPVYSYDWPDQHGIQYDEVTTPKKQARVFTLKGWILANSKNEFKNRLIGLEMALFKNGHREIYCKKYNTTVYCRLKSYPSNIETPKGVPFDDNTVYGAEITIEFDEVFI